MPMRLRMGKTGDPCSAGRRRRILRGIRLLLLLGILALTTTLNVWSRQGDPRFFAFLSSPAGRVIANVFGWWRSPLERPPLLKSDRFMTAAERVIQGDIEGAVAARVRATHPSVKRIPYEITYRDVKFRKELPGLRMVVHPPYLVLTDAPEIEVDRTVEVLRALRGEMHQAFGPLYTRSPRRELIHLAYFADSDAYLAYQTEQARTMKDTSGFYSPTMNRLVLFRQASGPSAGHPLGTQTTMTARHEAAHQFLFTYGVHSPHRIENEWLLEGLASYCEPGRLGGCDGGQVRLLQTTADAGQLIPLRGLVNHRNNRGLLAYKPAELAYGQSWALVHFLMQDAYRDGFFKYVSYIRDTAHFRDVKDADRFTLLAGLLNLRPSELESRWHDHVRGL